MRPNVVCFFVTMLVLSFGMLLAGKSYASDGNCQCLSGGVCECVDCQCATVAIPAALVDFPTPGEIIAASHLAPKACADGSCEVASKEKSEGPFRDRGRFVGRATRTAVGAGKRVVSLPFRLLRLGCRGL